jgi:hypothetical protein
VLSDTKHRRKIQKPINILEENQHTKVQLVPICYVSFKKERNKKSYHARKKEHIIRYMSLVLASVLSKEAYIAILVRLAKNLSKKLKNVRIQIC